MSTPGTSDPLRPAVYVDTTDEDNTIYVEDVKLLTLHFDTVNSCDCEEPHAPYTCGAWQTAAAHHAARLFIDGNVIFVSHSDSHEARSCVLAIIEILGLPAPSYVSLQAAISVVWFAADLVFWSGNGGQSAHDHAEDPWLAKVSHEIEGGARAADVVTSFAGFVWWVGAIRLALALLMQFDICIHCGDCNLCSSRVRAALLFVALPVLYVMQALGMLLCSTLTSANAWRGWALLLWSLVAPFLLVGTFMLLLVYISDLLDCDVFLHAPLECVAQRHVDAAAVARAPRTVREGVIAGAFAHAGAHPGVGPPGGGAPQPRQRRRAAAVWQAPSLLIMSQQSISHAVLQHQLELRSTALDFIRVRLEMPSRNESEGRRRA